MPRKTKELTIKEIRGYIEGNIKAVSDVTASRIYEIMTGNTAATKTAKGTIRIIT
jgi:hypothetical protein